MRHSLFLFHALMTLTGLALLGAAPVRAQQNALKPQLIQTQFPTEDYVIASAVVTSPPFAAKPDGITDCTHAIQSAIDAVAGIGGGVVFLPAGRYLCRGSLLLREDVTLRGDWKAPGSIPAQMKVQGTILMPTAGRGQAEGTPFITIQRGTGLRNLSIWYPEQNSEAIVPYPWTIASDQSLQGHAYTMEQMTLVNPYQAVQIGPVPNDLHTIRQFYATPLKSGFSIDSMYDIGRIAGVRLGPTYWLYSGLGPPPNAAAVKRYMAANATGITLFRSDWQYLYDVTLTGFATGIHLRKSANGSTGGVLYNVSVTDGTVGLVADDVNIGLTITNCRIDGSTAGVWARRAFVTDLQFNNCRLGGQARCAVQMDGDGAMRMLNCTLASHGSSAFTATHGFVSLLNCTFPTSAASVTLGKRVRRAILVGCQDTKGHPARLANGSRGVTQIDPKPLVAAKPNIPQITLPPDRRPAKALLFNVADYGAKADGERGTAATDNTAAFQKALDTAGAAGGGEVFVPAGNYRFGGSLVVPSGVELRGCWDVPHHTISLGSVLLPTGGRGEEHGTPFIRLSPNSGARGLTTLYPDQRADDIVAYPWTVQSLGPKCWLIDFTVSNPYQLADFGTYPSEGHLLRYVAGSPLRRGLWVSKGSGDVDSCQFNLHYWFFKPPHADWITYANNPNIYPPALTLDYQTKNLEAFVFGSCPHTLQVANFGYGNRYGLRFISDQGKSSSGTVIHFGADATSCGISVEAAAPAGLQIVNTQIANVGDYRQNSFQVTPSCQGPVAFFGGMSWGVLGHPTMQLAGSGTTRVQGWMSQLGEVRVQGGHTILQNLNLTYPLPQSVAIDGPVQKLEVDGCIAMAHDFHVATAPHVVAIANGRATLPVPLVDRFAAGQKPEQPTPSISVLVSDALDDQHCEDVAEAGRNGNHGLVLTGTPHPGSSHAYVYFIVYPNLNLPVTPNTILRYWLRPDTLAGTHTGIDLLFTDGTALRESGAVDTSGQTLHPAATKGQPGQWTLVEGKIGSAVDGKVIKAIMFAYDENPTSGPVKATLGDIEIGEAEEDSPAARK